MKDLTRITTPFGLLGKKTRKALKHAAMHRGRFDAWIDGKWMDCGTPMLPLVKAVIYRVKPDATNADPHHIFAAVKEWQEARKAQGYGALGAGRRYDNACEVLMSVVPS